MKKLFIVAIIFISALTVSCGLFEESESDKNREATQTAAVKNESNSLAQIPVPQNSYFQERRTVANWAKRWDKPNLPCYVYLFNYGTCIGYFVSDGKPASTRSYLVPEYKNEYRTQGCYTQEQTPDLDGTYGDNNEGIRFFTASGSAVEAGAGISYVYSDTPLNLNVTRLN